MPLNDIQTEEALQALARSTEEVSRAAEVGDLNAVEQALAKRQSELSALEQALNANPWNEQPPAALEAVIRGGDQALRTLRARRETLRARISEAAAEQRQLYNQAPATASTGTRLDLSG